MMECEQRVQIRPDFQQQLPIAPINKKAEELKLEYKEKLKKIKQKKLVRWLEEERVKEVKEQYEGQIRYIFTGFYNRRLNIAKANIGSFYSALFDALFPGKIMRTFKTDKETLSNGEERNFHPDHIRYEGSRKIFTEIKSISQKNSKPWCSDKQLENYCFDLLKDSEQPLLEPQLEYAFFRYSQKKQEPIKTSKIKNQELARKLACRTQDLLVVPSNLLFLMMMASNKFRIDQTTNKGPDEASYWKIYGTLISKLHAGEINPAEIARELSPKADLTKELCLDNLVYTQTQSQDNLDYAIFKVKPFRITQYQNKDSRAWLNHFRQNHNRILEDILGLKDIYQESGELPF